MTRPRLRALMLSTLAVASLGATAALANPAADKCAASLSPEGQLMHKTVAPHVKADSDIEKLMRSHLRGLVMGGKLKLKTAEANGQAVGRCLNLLKG
ncbi:MAG: hypothetical protein Q7V15_02740 [Phenylobacterium sp.]|uniref:hypothetical protein n=1 Tax=Phenylobacterium sp. TaxID=1871053 RepID=UPI00271843B0|nr:hypothetical protein [Phenylobacterium sp.]MDO8900249.1 hypothetical protein [Phenylobacterium sp.]MDP2215481.1 hypothetical protein [Phenylobacterium sp.]